MRAKQRARRRLVLVSLSSEWISCSSRAHLGHPQIAGGGRRCPNLDAVNAVLDAIRSLPPELAYLIIAALVFG
jgi:hypothetical protein